MTYLKEIIVLLSRLIMQFGGAAGIKRFLDNVITSTDVNLFLEIYNAS